MNIKRISLVFFVLLISLVYFLPNLLYPKQYVLILDGNGAFQYQLENNGFENKDIKNIEGKTYIFLSNEEEQEKYYQKLISMNVANLSIQKNLHEITPTILKKIGATSFPLGLDLQGGVHFLMEVDIDTLIQESLNRYVVQFNEAFIEGNYIVINNPEKENELYEEYFSWERTQGILKGSFKDSYISKLKTYAVDQNIQILRNRVNELGVSEPIIQKEGSERIVVQLPGVQDISKAKDIIGSTATLEFRIVNTNGDPNNLNDNEEKYRLRYTNDYVVVFKEPSIKGENIIDASSGFDSQNNSPIVTVHLNNSAGSQMANITARFLNEPMAEVYTEVTYTTVNDNGNITRERNFTQEIIHVARIAGVFSTRFQISGLASPAEAQKLAILLKSGALVAPVNIIEERTIGPTLGKQNIEKGLNSIIIGFILVLLAMIVRYRGFGLIANVSLFFNVIMIFAFLTLFQATLTLPGFAGILLTIGMSVDANVLIFERIKEEYLLNKDMKKAISEGYDKAFSTIFDANITTLLAAIILFSFGSGPIKGFAVTLTIGILCSMFTAIIVSRLFIEIFYKNYKKEKLF